MHVIGNNILANGVTASDIIGWKNNIAEQSVAI